MAEARLLPREPDEGYCLHPVLFLWFFLSLRYECVFPIETD